MRLKETVEGRLHLLKVHFKNKTLKTCSDVTKNVIVFLVHEQTNAELLNNYHIKWDIFISLPQQWLFSVLFIFFKKAITHHWWQIQAAL